MTPPAVDQDAVLHLLTYSCPLRKCLVVVCFCGNTVFAVTSETLCTALHSTAQLNEPAVETQRGTPSAKMTCNRKVSWSRAEGVTLVGRFLAIYPYVELAFMVRYLIAQSGRRMSVVDLVDGTVQKSHRHRHPSECRVCITGMYYAVYSQLIFAVVSHVLFF